MKNTILVPAVADCVLWASAVFAQEKCELARQALSKYAIRHCQMMSQFMPVKQNDC